MYLQPTENHWAADLEADNLLDKATRIWCLCLENSLTGEKRVFTDSASTATFIKENPEAIFVGHNFLAYDVVMLNRFWGTKIPATRVVDTYVLSQLYNPGMSSPEGLNPPGTPKYKRKGPHSLEAWGLRLKFPKTEFDDYSRYTPTMLRYCQNDVSVTRRLFLRLSERMRSVGFTETGAEIEHLAWNIIQNKQRKNGFPLNKQRAEELYVTLRTREEELKNEIYKIWPPVLEVVGEYPAGRKRDGSLRAQFLRHQGQYPKIEWTEGGGYRVYDYVAFNLGSPVQRIEKLMGLGWQPVKFTKKTKRGGGGNPQVDEDSLVEFAESSGKPEVLALAKWIVVNSRANMVKTWLDARNDQTGCVHGNLFLAGTLRYRHRDPNSANIPAVRTVKVDGQDAIQYGEDGLWTYESRDVWDSGGGDWVLVGIDGTGIQNRCLIHNLIKVVGEERVAPFKELSLHGDIHRRNIEVLGLANKAAAKKAYYTIMMGGGGARIAADQAQFGTKLTSKEGDELRDGIIAGIPGFYELVKALQQELEDNGRIRLCDDTPILVSSPHMVIPYILQGDESRLMKKALIYTDEAIRRAKLSKLVLKVADIHDEWQWRVHKSVVDDFIALALPTFPRAGEFFNYNIVIEGDAKVGKTWAETH
jgi:DNA polymerase I